MPGIPLTLRPRVLAAGLLLAVTGLAACAPPSSTPSPSSTAPGSSASGPSASGSSASGSSASAPETPAPEGSASAPAASGEPASCEYPAAGSAAKPVDPPPSGDVETTGTIAYTLAMTGGDVTLTMDRSKAPCAVNSFVSLADQGYFDGTACHRLADSGLFVLQCGDPTGTGSGGPGYSFADELTGQETYDRGVVAMANAGPDTNGSQFFLVWEDTAGLSPAYTVFATMDTASRDVVAQMAGEGQDGSNPDGTGKPNNPSEITKVTRD